LESGHKNAGDVIRLYDFFKKRLGSATNRSLAGLIFEDKADCLPLAAADLFAYTSRLFRRVPSPPTTFWIRVVFKFGGAWITTEIVDLVRR
jgi:hypothetical protein